MDRNRKSQFLDVKFPDDFFWGTATASHQIEGNNTNNDWWDGEKKGLPRSGQACDSYNRYEEDFNLAKKMHNNAHRFSIEWSRIEPKEGKFDEKEIEHYRKIVYALRLRGLEPFVTLHHFTIPIWLAKKGGWTNKNISRYFERYVKFVAERIGKDVKFWATINEPNVVTSIGYIAGFWPPFRKKDFSGCILSLLNMIKAHKHAYKVLHKYNSHAQVGIDMHIAYYEPGSKMFGFGSSVLADIAKYYSHYWFLDKIKEFQDFLGINYYRHFQVSIMGIHEGRGKISDFEWEIYPRGIYKIAKEAFQRYRKPIYILENGIADADDDQRPDFIKSHLMWLQRAISEGVDIKGYFHWSLLDNYEWAEGFTKRFGLVEVDFNSFKRTVRHSGKVYAKICKNNGFNSKKTIEAD